MIAEIVKLFFNFFNRFSFRMAFVTLLEKRFILSLIF